MSGDLAPGPAGAGLVRLRGAGTALVLDARGPGLPVVVHWGTDHGGDTDDAQLALALQPSRPRGTVDVPVPLELLPARSSGFRGRPGLSGSRAGRDWSPLLTLRGVERRGGGVELRSADDGAGLAVTSLVELLPSGVVRLRHEVTNTGTTPYVLQELGCSLPVPERAGELLDLTGRWLRETHPQRHPFVLGSFVREGRRGRTGHDGPLLLAATTPGAGWRSGEVWGVHLAWSGDSTTWAERLPDRHGHLGAAELLAPGEVELAPGESYATPDLLAAFSDTGLDGLGAAFHRFARDRPSHPRTPRPVVLNTWEAVYFDHRLDRLLGLADRAAALGVERFVLDDGWFLGRRDDTAGLGDWVVDPDVWPDGLTPLVDRVTGLGMQFGLWVEPEMVNPDSELFRAHPDWVLGVPGRLPPPARSQQVLDLTVPEAYAHLLAQLDALLTTYDISYLKWDHNRDLVEAADREGRPAVHRHTLAVYRLLDELRARHPGVEIESCSSGGGRVDLGILARTDRVWASDTNDPLERQVIQRWTGLVLPPELVGAHVGPAVAHTTGRATDLSFRVATALFGSFGIEWDVSALDDDEAAQLADGIRAYRRLRGLLHGGTSVHADLPDAAGLLHGVVSPDGGSAVYCHVQLTTSPYEAPGPVPLPGLDPGRSYRVVPLLVAGEPHGTTAAPPPWWEAGELVLDGGALGSSGLCLPALDPAQAVLVEVRAV